MKVDSFKVNVTFSQKSAINILVLSQAFGGNISHSKHIGHIVEAAYADPGVTETDQRGNQHENKAPSSQTFHVE